MFANNACLYQKAKTARVDRFISDKALDFIDRCAESNDETINKIARFHHNVNDPKYLPVAFWAKWRHHNNTLTDGDKVLIFNKSQRGIPRLVYSTSQ